MPATFFSPKANGAGAALFASFNSKDGSVFFKFIRQTSWDANTRKGGFTGGEMVNFKLSQDEAADIVRAIRTNDKVSFFHNFDGKSTTGNFNYYEIGQGDELKRGFGLSIKKENKGWKVGLSLASAERLKLYLEFALNHIFSAIYAVDKKQAEEYLKKKAAELVKNNARNQKEAESDFENVADVEPAGAEEENSGDRDLPEGEIEF